MNYLLILCSCLIVVSSGHEYTKYTPEELLVLKQIKTLYKPLIDGYDAPIKTDMFLIHVIRARKGDFEQSLQLLKIIYEWRIKNNIDNILNEDFSEFRRQYPFWVDDDAAYDHSPVATIPLWDIRKIVISGLREKLMRYIDYGFEDGIHRALNITKIIGKEISQGIMIIDLNGYSPRSHACLACLSFYTDFFYHWENYYPQSTSAVYLVNTPRIFTSLLEILKPLMSDYTRSIIKIFGVNKDEYRKVLLKIIPIEKLRTQVGGNLRN